MRFNFHPVPWLPGRHLETIVPALFPAPRLDAPEEMRIVQVSPDAAVRLHVSHPHGKPAGTILLVHGMCGSSESAYMKRTGGMAVGAGLIAVRMNCRNCGGTETLSRTLYNAGQSADVGRVLDDLEAAGFPRPFGAVGFSLGGALVLRYAGESGSLCAADVVAGVNPPVDLEACCRALERPENFVYQAHFTLSLCRMLRRIRKVRPLNGPEPVARRIRTLRRLETIYTAPDGGYRSAEHYYAAASAGPHLRGIAVPSLVISSENDPFVPPQTFTPYHRARSGRLRFVHPRRGGHLGYWQARQPRFWAGEAAVEFVRGQVTYFD